MSVIIGTVVKLGVDVQSHHSICSANYVYIQCFMDMQHIATEGRNYKTISNTVGVTVCTLSSTYSVALLNTKTILSAT